MLERRAKALRNAWDLLRGARRARVGLTPADVVHAENKLRVLRYRSEAGPGRGTPVLLVPSLINRHYILDLQPGKSLAEHLIGLGLDVSILDWGTPGPEDRYVPFDEYAHGYISRAARAVARAAGRPEGGVVLAGYCLGGTLALVHAALDPAGVRGLVCLATPVDFSAAGLLALWTKPENLDVDRLVDSLGNVPWPLMQASFHMLLPTAMVHKAVLLHERLWDDQFLDSFLPLERWANDNVSFPGEAYRTYVKALYQDNRLFRGNLVVAGRRVDLGRIACPVFVAAALDDHIVPPGAALPVRELVGSAEVETVELRGGHIGAIVSRTASRTLWPRLGEWLVERTG